MDLWRSACSAVDAQPMIDISGTGMQKVDGRYAFNWQDCSEGTAPSFRCGQYGRWLFFDEDCRWRVGLVQQMRSRRGGNGGYLRSNPMRPGLLPTDDFTQWEVLNGGAWIAYDSVQFCGAQGDLVLLLNPSTIEPDG